MNTKPITPAEVKAAWDSLENPSPRKVAEQFDATGRPIDCDTIAQWKREGWPGTPVAEVVPPEPEKAESEKAELKRVEPKTTEPKVAPPRRRNYAQRAEDVLFKVISTSESLLDSVRDIAATVPSDGAAAAEDGRPAPALKAADSIAKLIKASSEAANMAIEGLQRIPALRIDDAEAPGAPDGQGTGADEDYPLRGSMEAYDEVLKEIRERKS